jgi:ribonuclease P/MRP protein subunit RPP40
MEHIVKDQLFAWSVALNDSNSVDVIYIDFKRAFDSIVYSKLIHKLTCYGISGKLLAWISAFLHNRLQSVVIENTNSTYVDVISGVPQGSVLGPILFILFIMTLSLPAYLTLNLNYLLMI